VSFWDAIANLFRGPSFTAAADGVLAPQRYAAIADVLPTFEAGKARWPEYNPSTYDRDVYRKIALIFRCLSLISHAAGTAKVRVYDEANDDDEITDHPMRALIRQPNPRMGEAKFWGTVALRAGLAGFCVVEKERNGFGDVVALNPLVSARLKAIAIGAGAYDWQYRTDGVARYERLKYEDAIVFTWADTADGSPYGMPPLATAFRDVGILNKLTEYLGNLLDRGGVPMWMLIPNDDADTMDQAELDEWTEAFMRRRGGADKRGIPWYAEGIKDAKELSYDPAELAMDAVRDIADLAICQCFGVPPRKAGTRAGLEHTTQNATAAVEDGEFYRDTIVPLWSRFDDALTTGLLPDFETIGSSVQLNFDVSDVDALQEDRNTAATAYILPGFSSGLLSNHMALRELGIPIPDGLEERFMRGLATEWVPAGADPAKPAPAAGLAGGTGRTALTSIGPSAGYAKRGKHARQNKKLIANVAEAREPSLKRFLNEQRDRVVASYQNPLGVKLEGAGPGEILALHDIDWQDENDQLRPILSKLHQLAGETAFDAVAGQVGVGLAWDLANPRVKAVVDKLAHRVVDINQVTRDAIANVVTAGENAGKRASEIADDLKGLYDETYKNRSFTIARTESMVSYGEASKLAYKESGVVDRAQIFDNPDHTDDYVL
jgi:HK97 family phage portal protein